MISYLRCIVLVVAFAAANFTILPSQAATFNVPGDQSSVEAAVGAASSGDTIIIQNSASYSGGIIIGTPITLIAASGQSPTITNAGDNCLYMATGSAGSQIGSIDGGTITLDGGDFVNIRYEPSATTTNYENLLLQNAATYCIYPAGAGNYNAVFTKVTFDGSQLANYHVRWGYGENLNMTFDRCRFFGGPYNIVYYDSGGGTVNFNNCIMEENGREVVYFYKDQAGDSPDSTVVTFNFNNCYLKNSDTSEYYGMRQESGEGVGSSCTINVNMNRCAIIGDLLGIYVGTSNKDNKHWTLDNCDIFEWTGRQVVDIYPDSNLESLHNFTFALTDCNLVGNYICGWQRDPDVVDGCTADYCNAYLPTRTSYWGGDGGWIVTNGIDPPANPGWLIAEDPEEAAVLNGYDFTVTESSLLTADSTGGVVGSNTDFTTITQGTPTPSPTPGPNRAGGWSIY